MAVSMQPSSAMFREGLQLLGQAARRAQVPAGNQLEIGLFSMASCASPALGKFTLPSSMMNHKTVATDQHSRVASLGHFIPKSSLQTACLQQASISHSASSSRLISCQSGRPHVATRDYGKLRVATSSASCGAQLPAAGSFSQRSGQHNAFHSSHPYHVRSKAGSKAPLRLKQTEPRNLNGNRKRARNERGKDVACNAVAGSASALDVNIYADVLVQDEIDIDDELDVRELSLLQSKWT
jgi:hypothetical protein